jgi:hypothetical protein
MNAINKIYLRFFVSFFIALFFSFWLANTWENPKYNNDIKSYSEHYNCLGNDFESIGRCSEKIGYPVDFIYELNAYLFKLVFGNDFFYFIFLFLLQYILV